MVYWSKNHKYDFMHKRTSLVLGPELRYVSWEGVRHPRKPNLMVGLPLYYLIFSKEFINKSLNIQKHVNLDLAQSRGKQNMA